MIIEGQLGMGDFKYKTEEIRELRKEFQPRLHNAKNDLDLNSIINEFGSKMKELGGYQKAFSSNALRGKESPDSLIIGRSPSDRFIYIFLPFLVNGTIAIRTNSGPFYIFDKDAPEFKEYLNYSKEWHELNLKLKNFEKIGKMK